MSRTTNDVVNVLAVFQVTVNSHAKVLHRCLDRQNVFPYCEWRTKRSGLKYRFMLTHLVVEIWSCQVSDHSFKRFKLSCNVMISCTVFSTLYSFTSSAYNLHVVLPYVNYRYSVIILKCYVQSLIVSRRFVTVERREKNPCCCLLMILYFRKIVYHL